MNAGIEHGFNVGDKITVNGVAHTVLKVSGTTLHVEESGKVDAWNLLKEGGTVDKNGKWPGPITSLTLPLLTAIGAVPRSWYGKCRITFSPKHALYTVTFVRSEGYEGALVVSEYHQKVSRVLVEGAVKDNTMEHVAAMLVDRARRYYGIHSWARTW